MNASMRLLSLAIIITIIFALRAEASHSKKSGFKKKNPKKYGKKYGGDYKKKSHCSKEGCRKHKYCDSDGSSESSEVGPIVGQLKPDYVPPPVVPNPFGNTHDPKPEQDEVSPEADERGEDKDEPASGDCDYPNYGCQPPYLPAIIIQQPQGYGYGGEYYGGANYGRHRNPLTREDRTQTTKPSSKPKPTPQQTQNPNNVPLNQNEEGGMPLDLIVHNSNAHNRVLARSTSTPQQACIGQRKRLKSFKITKDDLCTGFGGFFVMVREVSFMQRDQGCRVITSAKSGNVTERNIRNVIKTIVSCLGVNRAIRVGSYFGNALENMAITISQNSKWYEDHPINTSDPLPLLCCMESKAKGHSKHRYSSSSSGSSSSS